MITSACDQSLGACRAAKVDARKAAKEAMKFAEELVDGDEAWFWEVLATEAAKRCGKVVLEDHPPPRPMNDEQAKKFGESIVEHGPKKGQMVEDVHPSYWLAVAENQFTKDLQRYVKSKRFYELQ